VSVNTQQHTAVNLDAPSQPLPPTVRYERQERHKEEVVGERESRGEGVAGLMVGHEVLRSRPPRRVKDCTPGAGVRSAGGGRGLGAEGVSILMDTRGSDPGLALGAGGGSAAPGAGDRHPADGGYTCGELEPVPNEEGNGGRDGGDG